jgi:hypothetical protein
MPKLQRAEKVVEGIKEEVGQVVTKVETAASDVFDRVTGLEVKFPWWILVGAVVAALIVGAILAKAF